MILDAEHLGRLHAGETITVEQRSLLAVDRSYPVHGENGRVSCRAKVLSAELLTTGLWVHYLVVDRTRPDTIRLLARRSQHGYTANHYQAMSDEPEAVDEQAQEQITKQGREAHDLRNAERLALMESKSVARRVRQELVEAVRAGQDIHEFLSVVRRELDGLREGRAA